MIIRKLLGPQFSEFPPPRGKTIQGPPVERPPVTQLKIPWVTSANNSDVGDGDDDAHGADTGAAAEAKRTAAENKAKLAEQRKKRMAKERALFWRPSKAVEEIKNSELWPLKAVQVAVDTATRAEIRHYQNPEEGDGALMDLTVFLSLFQEIAQDYLTRVRFTATAIASIHEVVEEYMITVFASSYKIAQDCKRTSISAEDIKCVVRANQAAHEASKARKRKAPVAREAPVARKAPRNALGGKQDGGHGRGG